MTITGRAAFLFGDNMPTATNVIAMTDGQPSSLNAQLMRKHKFLDRQYREHKAIHQDISKFIAVGRGRFVDQGYTPYRDVKKGYKLIDPTPAQALTVLGAGLHGGLSSPARPWVQLGLEDSDMNKYGPFRDWMDDTEKRLASIFKKSNLYNMIHGVYEELGAFGIGCVLIDDHPQNLVQFHQFTIGDYRVAVSADGMCHTMTREIKMAAFQVVELFGAKNCTYKLLNLYRRNEFEWVTIIHVIEKNPDRDINKIDYTNMPIRSVYFEKGEDNKQLSYKGYQDMPLATPRWSALTNEAWGWGPGLLGLGLSKATQKMEKTSLKLVDLASEPPMGVPPSLKDRMLDLTPGAKNPIGLNEEKGLFPLVNVDLNGLDALDRKIDNYDGKMRSLFYNDLFMMIINDRMGKATATEILERHEEKLLMIGPAIERQLHELLDIIVNVTLNKALRYEVIPPPPPELSEAEYKIEYISLLAQAQKLVMSQSMHAYLGMAERVAQLDPFTIHKTDWNEYLDQFGDMVGLPAKIMNDTEEVEEMKAQAQEQQAKEQQMMEQQATVQNVKDLGQASTESGTALAELKDSVT